MDESFTSSRKIIPFSLCFKIVQKITFSAAVAVVVVTVVVIVAVLAIMVMKLILLPGVAFHIT